MRDNIHIPSVNPVSKNSLLNEFFNRIKSKLYFEYINVRVGEGINVRVVDCINERMSE